MQVSWPGYAATYQQEEIIINFRIQSHSSALLQLYFETTLKTFTDLLQ